MAVSEIKRQEKYEMKIYADNVISTDERFTMDILLAQNTNLITLRLRNFLFFRRDVIIQMIQS